MASGLFAALTSAELASLRTKVITAIETVLVVGQSYTVNGRSYTNADLGELQEMLSEITAAQNQKTIGGGRTYAGFRR